MRSQKATCRLCGGVCGTVVTVDEQERVVDVRGDHEHVMTMGYACIKGLQAPHIHHGPARLLHPQKRLPDGTFVAIPLTQALDEIAAKLQGILARHTPRAIAAYRGTQGYLNAAAYAVMPAFLQALGSPSFYSSATIDQSSKFVAGERLGMWEAGWQPIDTCDVWLAAGFNPLVSVQSLMGFPTLNPTKRMQALKAKGVKFILIDPRRTETSRYADIHLQPYPGEDAALAAGLLHIILANGWEDSAFCDQHVQGMDALRLSLAPFTPQYVAQRAGVAASDLLAAAQLFAQQSQRGFATSCTGPSMGPHSNLAVHLYQCLNVVCGRFLRAGEPVANPGVLSPRWPVRAQVRSPTRAWERGPRSRVGAFHGFWGEMMSNTLADEILLPGPDQVRSLFVNGGNPLAAFPDQRKVAEAFRQLELLVTIDPVMSATAQLSHYVIPPKVLYEREDISLPFETLIYPQPFAQHSPAIVPPPPGSDVVDDWFVFWALAQRLGLTLTVNGEALNMAQPPSNRELLEVLTRHSQVPLEDVIAQPGGKVFELPPLAVAPADDKAGHFEVAPADVQAEMQALLNEPTQHGAYVEAGQTYTHRLAVRRLREVVNSVLHDAPAIRKRSPANAAQLHPDDLASLSLTEGDEVLILSSHGQVTAMVKADDTLKPGVVTLAHCWGGLPGLDEAATPADDKHPGSNVNLLISSVQHIEPINAMARMTGIPVNIRRLDVATA
jgi:anaerobic selenocysteine-containing dehydrogenase